MAIYLDNAATTPMLPEALEAYAAEARRVGNASSVHSAGQSARFVVEDARARVAASLGADAAEVVFTAGGTEAINTAIKGMFWAARDRDPRRTVIVAPGGEHAATLETLEWLEAHEGAEIVWLPVDVAGVVSVEALDALIAARGDELALVTLLLANNEIGTIQPVARVARLAASAGIPVHTDAVAAFGQLPIDFHDLGVDALSVSAHKIGGPIAAGALVVRRQAAVVPLLHGGGQERKIRSGTVDAPAIAAFAAAADHLVAHREVEVENMATLRDLLIAGIRRAVPDARLTGAHDATLPFAGRLPANVHVVLSGCEGDSLVFLLDREGVQASNGSACTAGVSQPSHVLAALGESEADCRSGLRLTLGRDTTSADIDRVLEVLPRVYAQARSAGMSARAPQTF